MFQEWEESEVYKDVLGVAAEKTKSRLEAARRAFDLRRRTIEQEEAPREGRDAEGSSRDSVQEKHGQTKEKKEDDVKTGASASADDSALPVPSRLLAGAAAAAKGGIGSRSLEAVRSIFREEMRREYRRRENEEYRRMAAEMQRNLALSREERESQLKRHQEELSLKQRREETDHRETEKKIDDEVQLDAEVLGEKEAHASETRSDTGHSVSGHLAQGTSPSRDPARRGGLPAAEADVLRPRAKTQTASGATARGAQTGVGAVSSTDTRSGREAQQQEGLQGKTRKGTHDGLPTPEEEIVCRLKELSLDLAEASNLYGVPGKTPGSELTKEGGVLRDTAKTELEKPGDVFAAVQTGDSDTGGKQKETRVYQRECGNEGCCRPSMSSQEV